MKLEEHECCRCVTVNKLTLSRNQSRMEGAALPSSALDRITQTHPHVTTKTTSSTLKPCVVYSAVRCRLPLLRCILSLDSGLHRYFSRLLPESKGRQKIETCWIHSRCLIMIHRADSEITNPTMVKAGLLICIMSQAFASTRSLLEGY